MMARNLSVGILLAATLTLGSAAGVVVQPDPAAWGPVVVGLGSSGTYYSLQGGPPHCQELDIQIDLMHEPDGKAVALFQWWNPLWLAPGNPCPHSNGGAFFGGELAYDVPGRKLSHVAHCNKPQSNLLHCATAEGSPAAYLFLDGTPSYVYYQDTQLWYYVYGWVTWRTLGA